MLFHISIFMIPLLLDAIPLTSNVTQMPFKVKVSCFPQYSYDWDMMAVSRCGNPDLYHCLQDGDGTQTYYEFCMQYIFVSPGNFPVYDMTLKYIIEKPCPDNTYQRRTLKSSQFNACTQKSECKGYGQQICNNGSRTMDRRCKCNYRQGMVILSYGDSPSNQEICCPISDTSCKCWDKKCDDREELNEVYQCICKHNFHRPNLTSGCIPKTDPFTNIETTTSVARDSTVSTSTLKPEPTTNLLGRVIRIEHGYYAVVLVVVGVVLISIVVAMAVYLLRVILNRYNKSIERTQEEKEPGITTEDLEDDKSETSVKEVSTTLKEIQEAGRLEGNQLQVQIHHHGDIYNVHGAHNSTIGKNARLEIAEDGNAEQSV